MSVTGGDPAIEVVDLVRVYRRRRGDEARALDGISFTVGRGETVGLLGPNGAGKTTLTRVLSTLLTPTSGTARVVGHDVVGAARAVRGSIGLVLGGDRGLYGRLTADQNVRYWAAMCGYGRRESRQRSRDVLERLGLSGHRDVPVERFSRGMIQRVHLARALVAEPQVLLLDEPTNGMDPNAAFGFRDLVRRLRAAGTTILLTTHDMNEAQDLCDRVLLMDQGTVIARGAPAELLSGTGRQRVVLVTGDVEVVKGLLAVHCPRTTCTTTVSGDLRIETGTTTELARVLAVVAEAGADGVSIAEPDLGDVYRRLIPDREFGVR